MKLTRREMLAATAAAFTLPNFDLAQAKQFFRLATLGPGSSPYLVMSTFAQFVNKALPDTEIQVNATGAATQHAMEAGAGQLDFFMWSASVHEFMKTGKAMYAKIPQASDLSKNLRAVFSFPLGLYHIVTYANSGIETLQDVKGKRVFLGPPGGGATTIMQQVLEGATGYKTNVDFEYTQLGWDAATQAFQDGRIDVYINPTNAPSPVIQQLALSEKVRLIGLSGEEMEKPQVKSIIGRPGGTLGFIDPKAYGENVVNTEKVQTLGSIVGIATAKHVPEEPLYQITKAFWETVKSEAGNTPWLRNISIDTALRDLNLPLHPGAVLYYREIGLDIPAELISAQ